MARPRKDQGDSAEQRIKDAFWSLLEQNDLKDITVSMITASSKCNRGTFYYHFDSLEELIDTVINEELFINSSIPHSFFYLICESTNPFEQDSFAIHVRRFGLMLNRAGQEQIDTRVKAVVIDMWENLLCPNNEELATEARLIMEYTISGLIGLISYLYREGFFNNGTMPKESYYRLKENSQYLVVTLSRAQNIPLLELEKRICNQLRDSQSEACKACMKYR